MSFGTTMDFQGTVEKQDYRGTVERKAETRSELRARVDALRERIANRKALDAPPLDGDVEALAEASAALEAREERHARLGREAVALLEDVRRAFVSLSDAGEDLEALERQWNEELRADANPFRPDAGSAFDVLRRMAKIARAELPRVERSIDDGGVA